VDPDAAVAALELAVLLEDPIKGGIDPRHGGHFSFKEHYVVLDLATGDQLLDHYFHGAESRWRYSSHSLVRGFEGPGAKALALKLYCTARAALPARSLLTYDGQDNFDGGDDWDRSKSVGYRACDRG
jgi:hypothetical protein